MSTPDESHFGSNKAANQPGSFARKQTIVLDWQAYGHNFFNLNHYLPTSYFRKEISLKFD